jgi:hypothetical protein
MRKQIHLLQIQDTAVYERTSPETEQVEAAQRKLSKNLLTEF